MSDMRLVIRSDPAPDESWLGHQLRLSSANGYPSPTWLPCARTATLPPSARLPARRGWTTLHGSIALTFADVDRHRPKVCAACLSSRRVLPFAWEMTCWTACPEHGFRMLRECPHCGKQLSWHRRHLDRCCWVLPFTDAAVPKAPAPTVDLIRLVAALAGVGAPSPSASLVTLTAHLTLLDTLRLIRLLGRLGEPKATPGNRNRKVVGAMSDAMVDRAAQILAEWPKALNATLDAGGGGHATSDVSLRARFGPAYHRIKNASSSPFDFVMAELRAHAARGPNFRYADDGVTDELLVPLHSARLAYGLSYENARRLLRRGFLSAEKRRMGKFNRVFVSPSELASVVRELALDTDFVTAMHRKEALSRESAAKHLSIGKHTLEEICGAGLLGEPVKVGFRYFLTQTGLQKLLARLEALVTDGTRFGRPRAREITLSGFKVPNHNAADALMVVLSQHLSVATVVPGA